jgi:hypothetical protein
MKLSTAATCMLVAFIVGAYAGYRYAVDQSVVAVPAIAAMSAAAPALPSTPAASSAKTVAAVPAAAAPATAHQSPAAATEVGAPAPSKLDIDPETMKVILDMAERSRQLEIVEFPAQMRSEPSATAREAKIRAVLDPMLSIYAGARLARAECRTTLCQAEVFVPDWATEAISKDNGAGTLHTALSEAGLHVESISRSSGTEPEVTHLVYTMRPKDAEPKASVTSGH